MKAYLLFFFLLSTNCLVAQKKSFTLSTSIGTAMLLNAQTAKNPGIGFGLQYAKIQSKKIINWLGIQYVVLQKRPDEETYVTPFYYPETYYTPKNLFIYAGKKKSVSKSINIGLAASFGYSTGSETKSFAFGGSGDQVFKKQNKALKAYGAGLFSMAEIELSKNSSLSFHVNPQIKLFFDDRKNHSIIQTTPNAFIFNMGINYIHSFHFKK